jgi:hypothetical protein
MTSVLEALVEIVAGAWAGGLGGKARRVTIAILVLAPNHHTSSRIRAKSLSVPSDEAANHASFRYPIISDIQEQTSAFDPLQTFSSDCPLGTQEDVYAAPASVNVA